MLIIALNSLLLVGLIVMLVRSILDYRKFKNMYGEFTMYSVPSVQQARRHAQFKRIENRVVGSALLVACLLLGLIIQL